MSDCNFRDSSLPALLSMEFSRQEYWSGLPFPSPTDLPEPEIEPRENIKTLIYLILLILVLPFALVSETLHSFSDL